MANRLLRVLLLLLWLEMGLLIILIPWSTFWETNYFLNHYPSLIPILLNPYVRGAISGLGVVDAVLAVDSFRRKRPAVTPSN
ncbi:MAG: hypothetical protein WBE21_16350 [Candidatus Acidiferrales bacterium]|nr:hypothetical protein [Candidatus Acidoferrales bacterium]HEV2224712.1 hypothetical protein [Candidatus Acidoferrales bacterium]